MKKIISLLFLLLTTLTITAQTIVYRTKNPNVGFGINSDCINNSTMDFVVNGPLILDTLGYPVGGYIDDSLQVQRWITPETGGGNFAVRNCIFGLGQDGVMHMVSYTQRKDLPAMVWAFQNGPMLVQDGKNVCGTSASQYTRSGIGYTSNGTIVVIVSITPVTFYEFAQLFLDEKCVSAVFLDGGPTYPGYSSDNQGAYGLVGGAIKLQFFNNKR